MRVAPFTPGLGADAAARVGGSAAFTCPMCGERHLNQIPRRGIDRLLGMFVRLRRFRCQRCQWQGNLSKRNVVDSTERKMQTPKSMHIPLLIAAISAILLGIVALIVMLIVGWLHGQFEGIEGMFSQQPLRESLAARLSVAADAGEDRVTASCDKYGEIESMRWVAPVYALNSSAAGTDRADEIRHTSMGHGRLA